MRLMIVLHDTIIICNALFLLLFSSLFSHESLAFISSPSFSSLPYGQYNILRETKRSIDGKFIVFLSSFASSVGNNLTPSSDNLKKNLKEKITNNSIKKGAISMSINELSEHVGGWGRARLIWDYYRIGVDPLNLFVNNQNQQDINEIEELIPTSRKNQSLGNEALVKLSKLYKENYGGKLENGVGRISHVSTSSDGTKKLLIQLLKDGLEVETVIIPWFDKGWSTICMSSQVGCRQGCTFCSTGRMGILRSLSSEEILIQFFFALQVIRTSKEKVHFPEISNVVFMGMGEPADNSVEVNKALKILTDVELFHMGQTKVTVSTVAPHPNSFSFFRDSPCLLAWSVHAANDELRKKLVPTTKYSMNELRQELINTLLQRPSRLRATMIEVVLISQVNDSIAAALELAHFVKFIVDAVPRVKLVVNLIPFNDIGNTRYQKPTKERVKQFQQILWDYGVFAHVRTTRGDDESAACGQLATKKMKKES